MEIGVIFPQTEIEADPGAIRDFAQAAEDLGYAHIFIADHVLGADPSHHRHPSLGTYNHKSVVHESLVVMGFLSAVTRRVGSDLRHPHPAPAADRAGGQAGGGDRRAERGKAAAGDRRGLERGGVRGPERGLSQPGTP